MINTDALTAARRVYDDTTEPTYRSLEAAIYAYLSALPGEAEVVALVEKMRRGTPEKQVGIGRHGDRIIDVDLAATDALLLKAADVLQAMQARAEKAERERDLALEQRNLTLTEMAGQTSRAEAAEEAENEAKDAFWAIYPKYLEMGGAPVSTETARTHLAARVKELELLAHEVLATFGNTTFPADHRYFGLADRICTALKGGSNG